MTTAVLMQRVNKRVGEETLVPVYYSVGEILNALNMAQRLFVLLTLCLERTAAFPLAANTTHYHMLSTFTDWFLPLRVRVSGTGGLQLRPARLADLDALSTTWQSTAGTPSRYVCAGFDHLSIYKQPASTSSLDVTYARFPAIMTADSTPEIPEENHSSLIDGAIPLLRIAEGGQEWTKCLTTYWPRFLADAQKLANYVRGRNLAQRYDRVPPELSRADISKLVRLAIRPQKPVMLDIPQVSEEKAVVQ